MVAEQFNRVLAADIEAVRDFLVLHYHATGEQAGAAVGAMPAHVASREPGLQEEQFRRTGRIVLATDELFREASWFAVMMGKGSSRADYNPLVDIISTEENRAHLARVEQQIAHGARAHADA